MSYLALHTSITLLSRSQTPADRTGDISHTSRLRQTQREAQTFPLPVKPALKFIRLREEIPRFRDIPPRPVREILEQACCEVDVLEVWR